MHCGIVSFCLCLAYHLIFMLPTERRPLVKITGSSASNSIVYAYYLYILCELVTRSDILSNI